MVNQKIQDRLAALRAVMKENGVDWYMVPTADFHNSEYVDAYFKVREYLCNFSGSNGTLIVGMDEAGLWTDGRYFIQAERELTGTGVTLYRMLEDNVPTKEEFLQQKMEPGGRRHAPLLDGPRPKHPHRTHQRERLFVAPRHRFEPDTDRGVEVLRAQHTPGTRRADARRPAARIAQQRHRRIGRGVERRPAGQGERSCFKERFRD